MSYQSRPDYRQPLERTEPNLPRPAGSVESKEV